MKYLLIFWTVTSLGFLASRLMLRKYDRGALPVAWSPSTRGELFILAGIIFVVLPGLLLEVLYETLMLPKRKEEERLRWEQKLDRGC